MKENEDKKIEKIDLGCVIVLDNDIEQKCKIINKINEIIEVLNETKH